MKTTHLESSAEFTILKQTYALVVLDFYSEDCPPCEKLAPIYEQMTKAFPEIMFVKAFRQGHRALAESLGVSGSPTVLFFKDGELLDYHLSGYIEEQDFKTILETISGKSGLSDLTADNKKTEQYDLCIIGNGPAGLAAAVYGARYKINQLLIGDLPGGLMTSSHKICNFPSEIEISGADLTQKMLNQVAALEVPQKFARVNLIEQIDGFYELTLSSGETIRAKKILLATGTKHRHLNLPNEQALVGRGVSYCATCDAMFYANKIVAVIGGSDSANTAALYLAKVAKQVYQIYRGDSLRGEVAWIDQIKADDKITVLYSTKVTEIIGEKQVTGLKIDKPYNGLTDLSVDGIFVEVGSEPDQTLINQLSLEIDEGHYIKTQPNQMTSQTGVWAAGDITTGSDDFRQIITAGAEGAIAIASIFKQLQAKK